ncbi:Acyl-CoA N-acyltransferase [Apiospora hydei]|uniref:Acyl-CoA N-acyltransferase n=1 Tax=Apiospora hydei TaxID=1337664 RepID=A0ABR1V6K4_9PEZI
MASQLYETFSGHEITDYMLSDAAELFSNNYGVWGPSSPKRATIEKVSLDFIRQNAALITKASPIPYIKSTKLSGELFDVGETNGLKSGVDTDFFVDHEEPQEALAEIRKDWKWPLGDLPDGHEFLLILQGKSRRSRSRSLPRAGPKTAVSN